MDLGVRAARTVVHRITPIPTDAFRHSRRGEGVTLGASSSDGTLPSSFLLRTFADRRGAAKAEVIEELK